MPTLADLPPRAFDKADPSPDGLFYAQARFVAHIDARAIEAVTDLYRRVLPPGGAILDLMSSWISHLPPEVAYRAVVGLGLNEAELAANPRLTGHVVQDLNREPRLPFADGSFDGAAVCVSVQYLQRPAAVVGEVARVLGPGSPLAVTFSDRCFPTKAVAIWGALEGVDRARLVSLCLREAGFEGIETAQPLARDHGGDPLWTVVGRAPSPPASNR